MDFATIVTQVLLVGVYLFRYTSGCQHQKWVSDLALLKILPVEKENIMMRIFAPGFERRIILIIAQIRLLLLLCCCLIWNAREIGEVRG